MSALPDVPGVLRLDILYGGGADISAGSRVFFSYTGTAPTDATLDTMCTALNADWETLFTSLTPSETVFFGTRLTDLTTPASGRGEVAASAAGDRGTTLIPFGAAAVLDFKIARRYRGGKPRIYLPLGIDSDITGGYQWTSAFTGDVATAWTGFKAAVIAYSASGMTMSEQVAVSYYSGFTNEAYGTPTKYRRVPTLRGGGPVTDVIFDHAVAAHIGSQRRRNQSA